MKDFNSYQSENAGRGTQSENAGKSGQEEDVSALADRLTKAFAGKGEGDILRAIYDEAARSRKAGTLSDADLDNFYAALSPMLDGIKRKKLAFVINRLKKM